MKTHILIIGGGLAGLSLAWQLEKQGIDYQLIEARDRFGGRIHAHKGSANQISASFDMGPSWFWPGQPRIADVINQLGLQAFEQYSLGEIMFEDVSGKAQRGRGYASMQGSYRLKGSMQMLIEEIQQRLTAERLTLGCRATVIERVDAAIKTHISDANGATSIIESQKVVLALPPRVAAEILSFKPKLSAEVISSMQNIPTWMAGHAKVVAIYKEAFWRNDGLSGDAMSRRGPLVEIHDASPEDHLTQKNGPYALFGFMGIPAHVRANNRQMLIDATLDQLVRLFGEQAKIPLDIAIQDWAFEPETATPLDQAPLNQHPDYGLPRSLKHIWDGDIILSSTEAAPRFGGYLEGALEAAAATFEQLMQASTRSIK
jgi:monoamine oxidase